MTGGPHPVQMDINHNSNNLSGPFTSFPVRKRGLLREIPMSVYNNKTQTT